MKTSCLSDKIIMRQPDFIYYLLGPLVRRTLEILERRAIIKGEDYDKEDCKEAREESGTKKG